MTNAGRILIADDNEEYARITKRFLCCEGYDCDWVPNSYAAESKLISNSYDLLIADIEMPGNTELEFIRRVPVIAPGLPIILATAYPSVEKAVVSMNMQIFIYLIKPLDYSQLSQCVKNAIARYREISASHAE